MLGDGHSCPNRPFLAPDERFDPMLFRLVSLLPAFCAVHILVTSHAHQFRVLVTYA